MTADKDSESPGSTPAERAFAEYLRRREAGEAVDFEAYCREHPQLDAALRALHSINEMPDASGSGTGTENFYGIVSDLPATEIPEAGPPLARPAGATLQPGERVGPYQLLEIVGEGGFAFVYRAQQESPVRRIVALKSIKAGLDTKEVLARFEAERQALAVMNHPNIAKVFDAGTTEVGQRPYFVMEYVPGVPITAYCDRHRLNTQERLRLFITVCEAIQHAHQKAIIHRDLKPTNVLVSVEDEKPVPKVIDFGIAKATDSRLTEQTVFTEIGQIIGTPAYMSPEQAGMAEFDIDTRTDIYSLGVLLYELLAGAAPFDSAALRRAGYAGIQRIICEEVPPRPSTKLRTLGAASTSIAEKRRTGVLALARQLRGDLDWVTMKAMSKDRTIRYATASEFAADILRHLHHEPVVAGPPSLIYRLQKFAKKNKRQLISVLVLVTSLVVLGFALEKKHRVDSINEGHGLFEEGKALALEAKSSKVRLAKYHEKYEAIRNVKLRSWQPFWERGEELKAWNELERQRERVEDEYSRAFLSFNNAINYADAGGDSQLSKQVKMALDELNVDIQEGGDVTLGTTLFRQLLGLDPEEEEDGIAILSTDPPGAEIFCFRYENREQHIVPLPFDPTTARVVGKSFLRVERVWDPERSPFEENDRLLELDGKEVSVRSDFARVLSGWNADAEITAVVKRAGEIHRLSWVPFRATWYEDPDKQRNLTPGRVVSIRDQFGLTFAGYPLDFPDECRVGVTGADRAVEIELPRGSYLFVLRKEGYRDARYPVSFPRKDSILRETVRLLEESEIPPGFVHVPGGSYIQGSDSRAFQSFKTGEERVDSFFISRLEVTFGDYLKFLNDDPTRDFSELLPKNLVPKKKDKSDAEDDESGEDDDLLVKKTGDRWTPKVNKDWPVLGISYPAALEYSRWRTERDGDRWRYRLPTDREWERAARGADRRIYVWGDYMVWNFCSSMAGNHRKKKTPSVAGSCPLDESVFGAQDLMGSVSELTTDTPRYGYDFQTRKGGNWGSVDEVYFRIASRNGWRPDRRSMHNGIRLVAEPERRTPK